MPLSPNSAALMWMGGEVIPPIVLPDGRRVQTPTHEWILHQSRWQWLLDSYEGGEAYRTATYGSDLRGYPIRNLIRHKREYPMPTDEGVYSPYTGRPAGTDQAASAGDDDYEMRRARTPVPRFMFEAVHKHLSKIYNQEIRRDGPEPVEEWWENVDGSGATIDQWMAGVIAPMILTFGHLDILCDRPPNDSGEDVVTRADELRLGLNTCVASYVLPVNIPWYRIDRRYRYTELLMREVGDEGGQTWRYWNPLLWVQYDDKGEEIARQDHAYQQVPVRRVFDKKRPSCRFVGLPRYEDIAEIQREFYNRDSELILSDVTQAHPLTMIPEDLIRPDQTVGVGPGWAFPMKWKEGNYHGAQVLDYPKGAADSIRTNKSDLRDAADRSACLTKPAGAAGTTNGTVGQSGISKRLDHDDGNELLGDISGTMQEAEETIAELVEVVLGIAPVDKSDIVVQYPKQFDLWDAGELIAGLQAFETVLMQVGDAPETELAMLSKAVRNLLPGRSDEEYAAMDKELEELLMRRGEEKAQGREAIATMQAGQLGKPTGEPFTMQEDDETIAEKTGDESNDDEQSAA